MNLKVKTDSNSSSSRSGQDSSKPIISFAKDFDTVSKVQAQLTQGSNIVEPLETLRKEKSLYSRRQSSES